MLGRVQTTDSSKGGIGLGCDRYLAHVQIDNKIKSKWASSWKNEHGSYLYVGTDKNSDPLDIDSKYRSRPTRVYGLGFLRFIYNHLIPKLYIYIQHRIMYNLPYKLYIYNHLILF